MLAFCIITPWSDLHCGVLVCVRVCVCAGACVCVERDCSGGGYVWLLEHVAVGSQLANSRAVPAG